MHRLHCLCQLLLSLYRLQLLAQIPHKRQVAVLLELRINDPGRSFLQVGVLQAPDGWHFDSVCSGELQSFNDPAEVCIQEHKVFQVHFFARFDNLAAALSIDLRGHISKRRRFVEG